MTSAAIADVEQRRRPIDIRRVSFVAIFLVALGILLAGYMFLGRGFAHIGIPPIYVGEFVLALGAVATMYAVARGRRVHVPKLMWLLFALMAFGAIHTVPYLGTYGIDALRDATLWGYALFAIFVYVLVDRLWLGRLARAYEWLIPAFALWLPICLYISSSTPIDPNNTGTDIPLIFYKSQDMTVHAVAAIGFLVLCSSRVRNALTFGYRSVISYPLISTLFVGATISRGALLAATAGLFSTAVLGGKTRNWLPILVGIVAFVVVLFAPSTLRTVFPPGSPKPSPSVAVTHPPSLQPGQTPAPSGLRPTASPLVPPPSPPRDTTPEQLVDNIASMFGGSADENLNGTVSFRLAWWTKIVNYTVLGPYFWTGKGFGINLADDDGFQPNADHSLRAPHNSHITTLARMGVPGFVLWVVLQLSFAVGLLWSVIRLRRDGETYVAALGAWILVYWVAMVVDTSFDPYLEGPQGGIWFWVLFGLGMVVMRLTPRTAVTE